MIFAQRYDRPGDWALAGIAAAGFCLVSSAVYAFNDLHDRQRDRRHPQKRHRPLAAGRLDASSAVLAGAMFLAGGIAVSLAVGLGVAVCLAAYVALQAAYTLVLKGKMILDVMAIAAGFVLRAAAGAVAIGVAISPWLIVCTFTLCMFLGFCKRCNELAALGDEQAARDHRGTLAGYNRTLLMHLMTLSAGIAIVAFLLHASSPETVRRVGSEALLYTLPMFLYGVFRFAMLSLSGAYSDPTALFLKDRPFQATVILWLLAVLAAIQWGDRVHAWLGEWA